MEVFYFGPTGHRLLGVYDQPTDLASPLGVVLCPPVFTEYFRSHACLRHVARVLAERGRHVLRFDYFGTGDSEGDLCSARVADWEADVASAIDELRGISGAERITLLSVRLGATISAAVAARDLAVEKIVMWDPIADGSAYLTDLRAAQRELVLAHGDASGVAVDDDDVFEELVGFDVAHELTEDLASLRLPDLISWDAPERRKISIVLSRRNGLPENLLRRGAEMGIDIAQIDFDCEWANHSDAIMRPHDITQALMERT